MPLICVGGFLFVLEYQPIHTSQLSRSFYILVRPQASQTSAITCNCVVKTAIHYTMDNVQKPNCSECNTIVRTQQLCHSPVLLTALSESYATQSFSALECRTCTKIKLNYRLRKQFMSHSGQKNALPLGVAVQKCSVTSCLCKVMQLLSSLSVTI